jgi:hypothetical protein
MQLFSRGEFARAVKKHAAERHAKGFICWGQFVAMLFRQMAPLKPRREVCMGLASCEALLKHLGISESPRKSTLAYANENRPRELHQTVFGQLPEKQPCGDLLLEATAVWHYLPFRDLAAWLNAPLQGPRAAQSQ